MLTFWGNVDEGHEFAIVTEILSICQLRSYAIAI